MNLQKDLAGRIYSKSNIILQFILGFITIGMAIFFFFRAEKKDALFIFCALFTLGNGIMGIVVGIIRANKFKKANRPALVN